MSRGKRYDEEPKLNIQKVFAVIIAFAVIVMFIMMVKGIFTKEDTSGKIIGKSYFTVFKDDKWGVIDSNGEVVIDPSYAEMIVIPYSKAGVFICTYDVNYETGEYKTKVLNEKNEQIFKDYDKVEAVSNSDKNGNLIYDKNVLKVQKDGKFGLINLEGKQILNTEYNNVSAISKIENSYKFEKDGKVGIVNGDGKIVIEPQYLDVDVLGKDDKSGFIVKNDSGKYGIVDYSNKQIIEIKYDGIEKVYGNDLYVVVVNGCQRLVNKENQEILTSGFDAIKQILNSQENAVIFVKSGKFGIMNLQGQVLIDSSYDKLEETKSGIFIAKQGEKYGIINLAKEEKIEFKYNVISYNSKADIYILEDAEYNCIVLNGSLENKISGMLIELNDSKEYIKLRVNDDYKYYNFKFEEKTESDIYPNRTLFLSKKDGKYGYTDKSGKVIVDYIYDDAMEQNEYGFAAVKKDGKWGSINVKGTVVQEPTYNLDDYLLINFIGRWHFGQDINMNYYNQL